MRLATPSSLRELSSGLRAKAPDERHVFAQLAGVFDQCAHEIESRDAEIDGLKRALEALKGASA